jgi:hypothetical protein
VNHIITEPFDLWLVCTWDEDTAAYWYGWPRLALSTNSILPREGTTARHGQEPTGTKSHIFISYQNI